MNILWTYEHMNNDLNIHIQIVVFVFRKTFIFNEKLTLKCAYILFLLCLFLKLLVNSNVCFTPLNSTCFVCFRKSQDFLYNCRLILYTIRYTIGRAWLIQGCLGTPPPPPCLRGPTIGVIRIFIKRVSNV